MEPSALNSVVSIQEELELHDVRLRIPWGGTSPRALTACYQRHILKAQAEKSVSDFVNADQYDLWLPTKKAPWKYQGAPLLLSLEGD